MPPAETKDETAYADTMINTQRTEARQNRNISRFSQYQEQASDKENNAEIDPNNEITETQP